eukprot:179699-Rhodomonas_salina.1
MSPDSELPKIESVHVKKVSFPPDLKDESEATATSARIFLPKLKLSDTAIRIADESRRAQTERHSRAHEDSLDSHATQSRPPLTERSAGVSWSGRSAFDAAPLSQDNSSDTPGRHAVTRTSLDSAAADIASDIQNVVTGEDMDSDLLDKDPQELLAHVMNLRKSLASLMTTENIPSSYEKPDSPEPPFEKTETVMAQTRKITDTLLSSLAAGRKQISQCSGESFLDNAILQYRYRYNSEVCSPPTSTARFLRVR